MMANLWLGGLLAMFADGCVNASINNIAFWNLYLTAFASHICASAKARSMPFGTIRFTKWGTLHQGAWKYCLRKLLLMGAGSRNAFWVFRFSQSKTFDGTGTPSAQHPAAFDSL